MSEFVDCRTCKTDCVRADGNYGYTFCDRHTKPQPTNADRIRASIEDNKKLAELTIRRKPVFRRTKGYTETVYVCSDGSVTDDWSIAFNREMDWLQQPAEEDDHA